MKILVTGANGYIGSKVVSFLCDNGFTVIATDISNSNIDNRALFINANFMDKRDNWFSYFKEPDVCLHLAWRNGFIHNDSSHFSDLSSHYIFLTNLIDNGLKHLAIMGSMHEVGYFEGKIDENTPTNPLTLYAIAKDSLRKAMSIYCNQKSVVFQWLRGFYIYGDDSYGSSIFSKIRQASKDGKKMFPFNTGKNKYDFISVNELSYLISIAITQDSIIGIINCCSGRPVSLQYQIETYISKNNLDIKLDYGKYPERDYDSPIIYGDVTKINIIKRNYWKNKKILVTGFGGQLGHDICLELKGRGYNNVLGIDKDDLDITNEEAVNKFILNYKPDVIMHNAAWTAVDKAEEAKDLCFAVNVVGTRNIVNASLSVGAKIVYISTDYVFDGKGTNYFETNDLICPLSYYGKTKYEGELEVLRNSRHFIVRTSWVFGTNGNNFVKTILKLSKTKKMISVVDDQVGSPTYTIDLASLLCDMIETEKFGIYHATNEDVCSWFQFASKIVELSGIKDFKVVPVSTEEYLKMVPQQAKRPSNSRLSKKSLDDACFNRLPTWEDALSRYLCSINKENI